MYIKGQKVKIVVPEDINEWPTMNEEMLEWAGKTATIRDITVNYEGRNINIITLNEISFIWKDSWLMPDTAFLLKDKVKNIHGVILEVENYHADGIILSDGNIYPESELVLVSRKQLI